MARAPKEHNGSRSAQAAAARRRMAELTRTRPRLVRDRLRIESKGDAMFSLGRLMVALAFAGAGATGALAQDRPDEITVECASRDGRRTSCPADLQGYTFKDLRKQSDAPCEAGRNWGYTERGVWVDSGCRASFEFEYVSGALGENARTARDAAAARSGVRTRGIAPTREDARSDERIVACASEDGRREECRADLRGMRFVDVRKESRAECEICRNVGYDDDGVWVDEGCRGEFRFRRGDRVAYAAEADEQVRGRIITCESRDDDYEHCEAPGAISARVASQTSRAECVQGSTWGVDERGIWVDRGCRADFEVFTRLSDSPTGPTRF
jgi:hypothetical protein